MLELPLIDHRLRWVEPEIFTARLAPDCMAHDCRCVEEDDRPLADACCRYGVDVDLRERDRILEHADLFAAVLRPKHRNTALWFDLSAPEHDPEFESGVGVRTATRVPGQPGTGCIFLGHDGRGCALHVAAMQAGIEPATIKPKVCRLFPIATGDGVIGLAEDFVLYSCAAAGPSVYRVQRDVVRDVYGSEVVAALDRVEAEVLRGRLPVLPE